MLIDIVILFVVTGLYGCTIAQALLVQDNLSPYPNLAKSNVDVSPKCAAAFEKLIADKKKLSTVADAIGKPAAGLLEGNVAWIGHYDECTKTADYKYCTIQMQLNGTSLVPGLKFPISWGVCAPQECNATDISNAIEFLTEIVNVSAYFYPSDVTGAVSICSQDPPLPYDAGFICTVALCSVIILVAVFGALCDAAQTVKCQELNSPILQLHAEDDFIESNQSYNKNEETTALLRSFHNSSKADNSLQETGKQNIVSRLIQCFSISHNLCKLLDGNQSDRNISCLNGLRVISMFWVILGHVFYLPFEEVAPENFSAILSFTQRFGFQAVSNATVAVDSFFFISGFLIAFLTFVRMAKTEGKIPWFWFYFHRFWRLTPVYMFTILITMYLSPYFGEGPYWQNYTSIAKTACSKYWWTNLLYINNFYPKDMKDECLSHSWYLANDMQFFIVSPIFLVSLFMSPVFGIILLICTTSASFIITGTLIAYYDLTVFVNFADTRGMGGGGAGNAGHMNFQSIVYVKPYCRIAPYLVGIALGYAMYKIGDRKVKINPVAVVLGWSLATVVAVSVLYGSYPSIEGGYTPSRAANIIYGCVKSCAWSVSLVWVVFACKYGYGGWVNSILSWNGWVVLSRLTYTAYLIHIMVLNTFFYNFGTVLHFSIVLFAFYFAGILCLAYGMAAIFSLAVEYPFANLEKLFMPRDMQSNRKVEVKSNKTNRA